MAKFHINDKGEAGPCKATQGGCPFGGEEDHYSTPEEARIAFEASNSDSTFVKNTVKANERYVIRETHEGMTSVATYGSFDSPEEAALALEGLEAVDEGTLREIVRRKHTVKTTTHLEEEVIGADAIHLEKKWNKKLQAAVAAADAEYDARENPRGWIEEKNAAAFDAQEALSKFDLPNHTDEYYDALKARDEARNALLAADIVHVRKSNYPDGLTLINNMVEAEEKRTDAENAIRNAIHNSNSYSIARSLRIQSEDVDLVVERALRQFTNPRTFYKGSVKDLSHNGSWTGSLARSLRIQPEDVGYALRASTRGD